MSKKSKRPSRFKCVKMYVENTQIKKINFLGLQDAEMGWRMVLTWNEERKQ